MGKVLRHKYRNTGMTVEKAEAIVKELGLDYNLEPVSHHRSLILIDHELEIWDNGFDITKHFGEPSKIGSCEPFNIRKTPDPEASLSDCQHREGVYYTKHPFESLPEQLRQGMNGTFRFSDGQIVERLKISARYNPSKPTREQAGMQRAFSHVTERFKEIQ